jgi:hypothetical protein
VVCPISTATIPPLSRFMLRSRIMLVNASDAGSTEFATR